LLSTKKKFNYLVKPGVDETLAIFLLAKKLIKDDLSTLDFPIISISNNLVSGAYF